MSGTSSTRLTEQSLRGLANVSRNSSQPKLDQKSIAERSINYMQQRQSTASVGKRSQRQAHLANQSQSGVTGADRIFGTPSQAAKKKAYLEGGNTDNAPYFHKRGIRSHSRRAGGSHIVGITTSKSSARNLTNDMNGESNN